MIRAMDTFLAIASRREVRDYTDRPLPDDGAQLVVAIAGDAAGFDVGRAAQNMMLTAWNEGVGSVPNGIKDREAAERLVGAPVSIVLTFGYPAKPRDANAHSADEWSERAKRKPFDEVVRTL